MAAGARREAERKAQRERAARVKAQASEEQHRMEREERQKAARARILANYHAVYSAAELQAMEPPEQDEEA